MRRLVALGLLTLAGCGLGGDKEMVDDAVVDELLLQPGDLGRGFRQTYIQTLDDGPVTEGRYRYRRLGPSRTHGLVQVDSTARIFSSSDAADDDLEASRLALDEKPGWQPIDEPGLGEESFAATATPFSAREYRVFWREHNTTAGIVVKAYEELAFSDVLELARKQEQRIADAVA
jgi:hypothetical protein